MTSRISSIRGTHAYGMSIDDALLMGEPRTGRRRLEKVLVGNSARELAGFFADASRRAGPIALGVLAATTLSNVLDASVDAFVAPTVQLALRAVGAEEETLESVQIDVCGTPFAVGRFFAAVLDAFATLLAISVVTRVFSGGRLPRLTRCRACLSWIDVDAMVCPCCARDQRECGSCGDGRPQQCWRERFDDDARDDDDTRADDDTHDDDTDDKTDDKTDDTRAPRPRRRVWERPER